MYELSDEDKRKIREEEEAAIEKKRYRAYVRDQLQNPIRDEPTTVAAPVVSPPAKVEYFIPWGRVIGFTVVVCLLVVLIAQYSTMISNTSAKEDSTTAAPAESIAKRSPIPRIRREPHLLSFIDQQAYVKAGSYLWYTLKVEEGMESAKLIGKFVASGGSGNDVQVVIAEPDQFQNWANGHAASLMWSTPGKVTAGTLDIRLKPGTYNLGFSNKFSAFSDKYVTIEAKLYYETVTTVVD